MQDSERGDTGVLDKLFAHNAWANLKLLDFCAGLSDEQLDAKAVGGYGSIRDTLVHIFGAEISYVERVNGKLPPQPFAPDEFPGFAVLKDTARWTSDELLQLARSARADTLVVERWPEGAEQYTLASLIVQAITHAAEHRMHIATIVTQLGMEPPDVSVWNYIVEIGEYKAWKTGAGEA